ncbi:MAG TPA: hypothetical protein VMH22_03875 [bacterium]|nr:hypothetical protein [bacterium]
MNAGIRMMLLVCLALGFAVASEPKTSSDSDSDSALFARVGDIEQRLLVQRNETDGSAMFRHVNSDKIPDTDPRLNLGVYEGSDDDARLVVSVVYIGKDSLAMHSAAVLVGGKRFAVDWDESDVRRSTLPNGAVYEAHSFEPEYVLPLAVSKAPADTVIKVQLAGSKGSSSFTMSALERQAWREMLYYYDHFGYRNRKLGP